MNYLLKYKKYKNKYLHLKAGSRSVSAEEYLNGIINETDTDRQLRLIDDQLRSQRMIVRDTMYGYSQVFDNDSERNNLRNVLLGNEHYQKILNNMRNSNASIENTINSIILHSGDLINDIKNNSKYLEIEDRLLLYTEYLITLIIKEHVISSLEEQRRNLEEQRRNIR
jgi:hypothetical protein